MSRKAIVTFASRNYQHTHLRFRKQVEEIELFDDAFVWSEENLSENFRSEFREILKENVKGYGFWVWKPQVILQALQRLEDGDSLVYLDSGSHIVATGRERLEHYFDLARQHPSGILAFQMNLPEKNWTKRDLVDHLLPDHDGEILNSGQVQAGAVVISKRKQSERFIARWLEVIRAKPNLIDDSPSRSEEFENFVAHRHDQSVFSILAKIEPIALLSASEQYPEPHQTWSDLSDFPFHHRRDTVKNTFRRVVTRGTKKLILPLEVCAVKLKMKVLFQISMMKSWSKYTNHYRTRALIRFWRARRYLVRTISRVVSTLVWEVRKRKPPINNIFSLRELTELRPYYINLDRRTDRRNSIENVLQVAGFESWVRFPAVDGSALGSTTSSPQLLGSLGCAESHRDLIQLAKESPVPTIVCEDDLEFLETGEELLVVVREFFADSRLDVLCLAANIGDTPIAISDMLSVSFDVSTTACYIAKPRALPHLFAVFSESAVRLRGGESIETASIDQLWKRLQSSKLVFAVPNRRIAIQGRSFSDITGRVEDRGV